MKMSKVGNQTNSQDPQAVNSRVFVGNLNTFQCSKTDVERMFQRYGRLAGKFLARLIFTSKRFYKIGTVRHGHDKCQRPFQRFNTYEIAEMEYNFGE